MTDRVASGLRATWPGKRLIDVVGAGAGLIVLAPVMLIIAILVRATSPGPALFRQIRVGRYERPFTVLKFRTMAIGTADLPTHAVPAAAITPFGAWLRATKLDELPQLLNVVKGDMSLVGPRPALPSQTDVNGARAQYGLLATLRPGMTGLAQICGVDMQTPVRLAKLDALYGRRLSPVLDGKILMMTVLRRRNARRTPSAGKI